MLVGNWRFHFPCYNAVLDFRTPKIQIPIFTQSPSTKIDIGNTDFKLPCTAFRHSETLGICEVDEECVIQVSEFRDRPDLVCVFFNFFGVIREEFVGF